MQKAELLEYIQHPEKLNLDTLQHILRVKEAFPYFQTIRLLAVKNRFIIGDEKYKDELTSASAYVTDRKVLYDILFPLDSDKENTTKNEKSSVENISDHAITSSDALTATTKADESGKGIKPDVNDTGLLILQSDETEVSDNFQEINAENAPDDPEKDLILTEKDEDFFTLEKEADTVPNSNDLINKFIESNPHITPRYDDQPQIDISEDSIKEHDSMFTDTLAKIYIKQGYYGKAIFVYEKLILKFPEKSDYFAAQIETIKKLMNKQ